MSPDDPRHGTVAGEVAHRRAGQSPCTPCRGAKMRNDKQRKLDALRGIAATRPAVGYIRRVQALARLGWTMKHIADAGGLPAKSLSWLLHEPPESVHRKTAEGIDKAWSTLSAKPGPSTHARRRAERAGWPAPLAWDDIDDPDEVPPRSAIRQVALHGHRAGYEKHRRRGEEPCDACKRGYWREYQEYMKRRRKSSAA